MEHKDEVISKKEALENVQRALRRGALIYHYFCETLVEEFGEEKGKELIRKAVDAYGERIGWEAKKKAQDKGLPLSPENFESDLPDEAWKTEVVRRTCACVSLPVGIGVDGVGGSGESAALLLCGPGKNDGIQP